MALRGWYNQTRIDYNKEKSTVRFRVTPITAANFEAQQTLRAAFGVAMAGICGGVINKYQWMLEDFTSEDPASDPLDQREIKWLVVYKDDVTAQTYSVELPCADLTQLDPNDRAHANIGDAGPVDAWIAAFEAFALSPDGNAVTVQEITFVGRNI